MGAWREVTIDGKRADAFEPSRPAEPPAAVLFLHGHGLITLRDSAAYTAELERHGLRCLCPHGKRSWWGDVVCREFDREQTPATYLRERVLPWLAESWGVVPPRIALVGISMGGQGVLKLAYRTPELFPIVAAVAPVIDFYRWYGQGLPLDAMYPDAEAARQDSATLWLHPLNWPRHQLLVCDPADLVWREGLEGLASKLSSTGIPCETDFTTRRGGHTWEYFDAMAAKVVGFVAERMEVENGREK